VPAGAGRVFFASAPLALWVDREPRHADGDTHTQIDLHAMSFGEEPDLRTRSQIAAPTPLGALLRPSRAFTAAIADHDIAQGRQQSLRDLGTEQEQAGRVGVAGLALFFSSVDLERGSARDADAEAEFQPRSGHGT